MKLIVDCGATKIDWIYCRGGEIVDRLSTQGINFAQSGGISTLAECLDRVRCDGVGAVHFYGAGCRGEMVDKVAGVLAGRFLDAEIEVASDMLAAARALCGRRSGIACILGTGSNSCLYDGENIVDNVPAMGYLLGDEGSGAVLGRKLLNMIFKRGAGDALVAEFVNTCGQSLDEIIARVYRGERPGAYLASFAPFIAANIDYSEMESMVVRSFVEFFDNNVKRYRDWETLPVNFTGSVAANFTPQLAKAAEIAGCRLGIIAAAPASLLAAYHR